MVRHLDNGVHVERWNLKMSEDVFRIDLLHLFPFITDQPWNERDVILDQDVVVDHVNVAESLRIREAVEFPLFPIIEIMIPHKQIDVIKEITEITKAGDRMVQGLNIYL